MEYSSSLVTLPPSEESAQILSSTLWLRKCLFVLDISYLMSGVRIIVMAHSLDIVYLMSGVSIIVMAHSHTLPDKDLVFLGVLLGLFAAMSALCNR